MRNLKILIIDDDKAICSSLARTLRAKKHKVFIADSGEEGIKMFELNYPDVVFLDNGLPKMQGLEVISKLKAIDEDTTIVFMTAHGSIDTAVKAMKLGAVEYINKPFSPGEINVIIGNITSKIAADKQIQLYKREQKDFTFNQIVGQSAVLGKIIQLAKTIAKSETTTVLLLGESGTGKDVFAKAIHNQSNRQDGPFVTINCSSFPETLLESELFGHEKGAFTDAIKLKKGLFEVAQGGTVFLDEIGEVNLSTQVKLLGVLENRVVRRLGGTLDIPVDIRIISATNQDIENAVIEKTFRNDLYYRLKIFQITIPALRDHKEDIPDLVQYFINHFSNHFRKQVTGMDYAAKKLLAQYNWPGNVRELRNVIERAIILESTPSIKVESLPSEIRYTNSVSKSNPSNFHFDIPDEGIDLEAIERHLILQALKKALNNQTKASKLLNISRDTLRYKKKKHNL